MFTSIERELYVSTPYGFLTILNEFFYNYLVVKSVKGLLQINKDYAIKKTSIIIDTPAILCLQQDSKSAV